MWTLLQLNTSTILSYSRSVEPENHQIKSKPKSTSVTQFLWFSSVSQAQDSGSSEMQMVLGHTPSGFLLSTAHTSCLLLSDGIGPHLSLIWLVITESWHLQCVQGCTLMRLHLQQWTLLASHSTKLGLFSTSPLTPQLSGCPNQYHPGNSYT